MKPERGSNAFDALRLFAATSVVVEHANAHLFLPFLWLKPRGQFWFYDGVALFFVLSGFLVYRSAEKCLSAGRPIRQFYLNRFLRIAPAIYAYALVTSLLLLALGAITWRALGTAQFVAWFASNLLFVPIYHPGLFAQFGTGIVNGSLWTIPVEVSFYLVVPLLAVGCKRLGFWPCMAALSGLTVIVTAVVWWPPAILAGLIAEVPTVASLFKADTIGHMTFFVFGVFWATMWWRLRPSGWIAAGCLVCYVVFRFEFVGTRELLGPAWYVVWGLPLSYAALWVGYNAPRVFSDITARIGDLSFGVYIWHMVVINTVLFIGFDRWMREYSELGLHLVVLGLTFALAYASWWLVERPALRFKPFSSRPSVDMIVKPAGPAIATESVTSSNEPQ